MSVRDRLEQKSIGPTRSVSEDHTGQQFASVSITQRSESQKGFAYQWQCRCGAIGRVSQQELSRGVVPTCRACGGTGVLPTSARARSGASVEIQLDPRVTASPRDRATAAARANEIAALEKDSEQ